MTRLAAPLAATAIATRWGLETRPVSGGRLGGVAGTAADLLPQAGQLARQGGELGAQILVLLPLGADEISGA